MMLRTFFFLSAVLYVAIAAPAQEPTPLPVQAGSPKPVSPTETDPPLVQVPGASLRHGGEMPPVLYPSLAHLCRVQGDVTVRLILGVSGTVYPVGDAEGSPLLREAGRDYVSSVRFEPLQVDGRPIRAVSTATVPFRLQGADAGPAATGYLLRFEVASPEMGHTLEKVEAQIRVWLARLGLADRSGSEADPAATLLVRASLAKATHGKPDDVLNLRFLRLEDQDKAEGILIREKRILGFGRRLGNDRADVADEAVASQVQRLLDQVVRPWERSAKARDAEIRLVAEMATGRPLKALNFDFEKMRIRYQPPEPPYPPMAKITRIQGRVIVELVVDEQGLPILARAIEGPAQLRATAEGYAMAWQFEPAKLGDVPVRARFRVTVNFALH